MANKASIAAVAAALVLCVLPSPAGAGTSVSAPASPAFPFQQWVNSALVPTPNTPVNVVWSPCENTPNAAACASYDSSKKAGTIWINPDYKNAAPVPLEAIFFHELGHIFDALHFNAGDRRTATAALGYPTGSTWLDPANGTETFAASPGEWFAESARLCFMGDNSNAYPAYGFPYKAAQIQSVCSVMKAAASRKPPPALVRTTFTQTIPAGRKFESSTTFVPGSIRMTATIDGKIFTWGGVCTRSVLRNGVALYANSCNNNVVIWSKGSRAATVTFSGMPEAVPTKTAGKITNISARKKTRSR